MRLYLSEDLCKSKKKYPGDGHTSPSGDQHASGEHRGGSYAARARIGTEADGSPMYRYFKTMEEYRTYKTNLGRDKRTGNYGKKAKKDDDLERKVKKEQKRSSGKVKRKQKDDLYIDKD